MKYLCVLIVITAFATVAEAQISGGGNYTVEQSVIANGGGTSSAGTIAIEGTSGQSVAGTRSINLTYRIDGGFWTPQPFAPTAALVSVSGKVKAANGTGIRNALVTFTRANGTSVTIQTGSFGYFRFDEIYAGETVVISLISKRFSFSQTTFILSVLENITDLDFTALPEN
jgi:hypothetical protein